MRRQVFPARRLRPEKVSNFLVNDNRVASRVKLLVFAHTPPPHHGQSYMVQLLLEGLRADSQFEVYHINAQLSSDMADIGQVRVGKLTRIVRYCLQAISYRWRHGVRNFYYVPANPGRAPLYRDWIVMFFCRPFFARRIFHWHAAGLGDWLAAEARPWKRALSKVLLNKPHLSIVLSEYNRRDALWFRSRRTERVANGIPDPCPSFEKDVLPARIARLKERHADSKPAFRLLYVGLCLREKGLFDVVEAVKLANERGAGRFTLVVAGSFWHEGEQTDFERICAGLKGSDGAPSVEYVGFVSGEAKQRLFRESDCLCFPTYYFAESFGLVAVEAMAHGLPVIATNWRMIPEVLPKDYPGLVDPKSPEQIAAKLVHALKWDFFASLRHHYLGNFTADEFWRKMKAALLSV
jgi:glycosyltransferase involved in cell wall biosynthesis